MGRYRKIDPKIWNDAKFIALSNDAQRLFLFVLTHPLMTGIGAFRTTMGGMADELRLDPKGFPELFRELLGKGLVKYDEKACLIFAPNFLKYNEPENPNVVQGWLKTLEYLPECPLLIEVLGGAIRAAEKFSNKINAQETIMVLETLSERLCKEFGEPFPEHFPKGSGIQRTVNREQLSSVGADESSPAPQQAAIDLPEPEQPKVEKKTASGSSKKVHLADAFSTLPDEWRKFCSDARPDLDAEKVFVTFRFYYVSGKGAKTVRTARGWSTAWKNWVLNEHLTEANKARPKEKTPEEHRAYQRGVAIAYGFPEQYADECVDNRYSTGSQSIEDAVLTTARPQ